METFTIAMALTALVASGGMLVLSYLFQRSARKDFDTTMQFLDDHQVVLDSMQRIVDRDIAIYEAVRLFRVAKQQWHDSGGVHGEFRIAEGMKLDRARCDLASTLCDLYDKPLG